MTKLQLLHRALNERLMAAVEQIMEMVGGTVLEYEEETIRARKENEVLRRRLRWMEGANPADWPGPSEPITLSTPEESNPSRQDESAVNSGFGQESEALVIKTETTDHPLYSGTTLPQSVDQASDIAGTSTGIAYSFAGGMTWDSAQNYMAPLDFDPTSGNSRVRHWRGRNRRQRMSFACPDCGKVFGREQRLMIHMRIHSTERPYKYRRRKAFFYGDNKKKRKLHGLSQLSREIVDDLSDCSEQTNRSSASPERLAITSRDQEEEPGGLSTESDHTSSDKEPENRTATHVRHQHKKKKGEKPMPCHCPHCPDRVFARPCQLAMHMKTHTALVNLPNQAQSGTDEIMDAKMKSHKKQRKNAAVKKAKVDGKSEFRCPKCDRVFAFKTRLRFHMKSHKAEKALLHKSLKMPIQTEPRKEETMEVVPETTEVQNLQELKKTYACPHCDKVFIREGWLEPHIRTQHRKVKNRTGQFDIFHHSGRTRSQLPYSQQLRKHRIVKQKVTEESKQKNEESKKVSSKPSQSRDESNLVVAGYTQHLRKRRTVNQGVTEESKQKNEGSKKFRDKPSQSRDESNLVVAGYTQQLRKRATEKQGVNEESKQKNEESKEVNDKPSPSTDESNLVADVPKITTDEAEQSADLPKRGPDESKCAPEQSKEDTTDSDRETSVPTKLKRMFPCKVCGKEFVREKKLKKHSRKHIGRRLQDEKKRKKEQALREKEILEQAGMRREEKDNNDKTPTSNHNLNTTLQGSPNKELLRKGKTRGQGPLPCPFCGKVFAWEMRLMMHMQIHCGEKTILLSAAPDTFLW
ncbi:gastrula zinc finger protein xFG20-1 [Ctenopharyngodon idella]|uniref:gastrula zinc finger protein xFG20-1 n=1 Tax=Ctenopharyngodon idella TaxID=7959 RepID=UPI0022327677|nr:gastrula zinc finger protein xFG20-1 [Ctenopharyngodon idella]